MRMDEYLRTVTEQVRCSRMHDSIAEELKDHILDQAEAFEEEGTDHEQALELAVREMGDPVETGVALDRIHRPHMSVEMGNERLHAMGGILCRYPGARLEGIVHGLVTTLQVQIVCLGQ